MKAPAFQFYAAEWLADAEVQLMSLEEEGCYIRLLSYCWREGSIPADPAILSRLCKGGSTTLIAVVAKRFQPHPEDSSKLVHERLEKEREKQRNWREKSVEGGKKSAEKRQDSKSKTPRKPRVVEPTVNQEPKGGAALQSASSSSSSGIVLSPGAQDSPGGRPGEQPTQLQFRAQCAKFSIPAWYADRKFDDFAVKGWKTGATPIVWREAVRTWVVRDYENDGRPLKDPKTYGPNQKPNGRNNGPASGAATLRNA